MTEHEGLLNQTRAATTRTRPPGPRLEHVVQLLAPEQVIASPHTHFEYRIERLLGKGGYGQVYLAKRLGRSNVVPPVVCIKVSEHIDGWLREAYFGQLLDGHPRAIRVYRHVPADEGGGAGPVLPRPGVRASRRPQGLPSTDGQGVAGNHGAPRDRGHPPGARKAAPRADAPPRPHAPERVRLRGQEPEAGGFRHRPAAERSARDHRAHHECVDGPERHPRGRGPEVAGARRRLPGGAVAGDAGEG